ncbi:membrane protein insertase YidC [Mycoplasma sp. Mirounga ES2805-ORL]|uniref:membrane protein insertase YidC n=1 Tax=Mycoplasma sp. Mirounga ES2805-ORL TaxID=754514 RepID=UPI00197C8954|nr:membrane protein insertase YidC [Mycoplasma sp. Mirounga ES2805-ORL]QSF13515.1 membrane protein insertase YidC [Mycoplasma sp. Mirounga ES2805-ORL]
MKQNRSENFNYFTGQNDPNKNKKTVIKNVWKWIKIVLYLLVFAFTLTGCVQTMVIKSSNYTGSGIEFYTDKKRVSPFVTTFKPSDKSIQYAETNDGKKDIMSKPIEISENSGFIEYEVSPNTNYHVSYKDFKHVLDGIQNQVGEENYGAYDSKNSAIQLVDVNDNLVNPNEAIYKKNGKYLFNNYNNRVKNYDSNYKSIYNGSYNTISIVDPDFLNVKLDNAFIYDSKAKRGFFEKTIVAGKIQYKFVNKSNELYTHDKKYFIKNASLFEVNNNYKNSNAIYSRDILEALFEQTFSNKFYLDTMKSIDPKYDSLDKLNLLLKDVIEGKIASLTPKQMFMLNQQQRVLWKYLSKTENNNFLLNKGNSISQLYDPSDHSKIAIDKDGKPKFIGLYLPTNNKLGNFDENPNLIYSSDEAQKAITSWGDSWRLGPFFGLFVWPIAKITMLIRQPLPAAAGWTTIFSLIIAVVITRLISLAVTFKSTINQSKMEDLKIKKAKIDAKYLEFQGNKQMKLRQQQEIGQLYKKNGINPFESIVSVLITFPIFIAMWRVIQCVPEFKSTDWLGIAFSATSYKRLLAGEWVYLWILVVSLVTQVLSQLIPRFLAKQSRNKKRMSIEEMQAMKKSNKTQNIIMIVFVFITIMFSAGVQVYWIFTSLWTIGQTIGIHYFKKSNYYRKKYMNKATE